MNYHGKEMRSKPSLIDKHCDLYNVSPASSMIKIFLTHTYFLLNQGLIV